MFLQLVGEARLLANWSAADWGNRKKNLQLCWGTRPPGTKTSHWIGDENGTRPLERVADTPPPGTSSVQALQKKGHILTASTSPCPKDKFDAASEKGQSTGVKCKAATIEWNHRGEIWTEKSLHQSEFERLKWIMEEYTVWAASRVLLNRPIHWHRGIRWWPVFLFAAAAQSSREDIFSLWYRENPSYGIDCKTEKLHRVHAYDFSFLLFIILHVGLERSVASKDEWRTFG